MRARILMVCVFLAAPVSAPAVDKAIMELQRDIAQLQQQVKDLQRSQDEKFAAVTELARQAIEAANRANTGAAVIQSNLDKSLRAQQDTIAAPLAGANTRMNEISNNLGTLTQAVTDLTTLLNRMQAQMTDINNKVSTMQQPVQVPTPPGGQGGAPGPGPGANAAPTPCSPASQLYSNALADFRGGKFDIAIPEFTDYLRCYGNTDLAPNAQFYIAQYHYSQKNFEDAVREFDMVLEKYPDNNKTAESLLYKGRALAQMPGHKTEGANEFREVIKRFPRTDQAKMACDDLKSIGYNCPAPTVTSTPKKGTARKK
jgi:tol-pal system protein YbgF